MTPSSQTLALVLTTISLIFLLNSPLPTTATSKLVESICKQVPEFSHSKCVESIELDPPSSSATNLHDLAKVVLEAAITNATNSQSYIKEMLKRKPSKPIKDCAYWYKGVVNSFKSALSELDVDIMTANYDCLIASDYSKNCETSLASSQVKVPSISSRNDCIKLYSYFLFATTNKLG